MGIIYRILLILALTLGTRFLPATSTPNFSNTPDIGYTVPEIKVFSLQRKDVVAIAVEQCLPTADIPDPLQYMMRPQYSEKISGTRLEVTLSNVAATSSLTELTITGGKVIKYFNGVRLNQVTVEEIGNHQLRVIAVYPDTAQVRITTVKRKRVNNPDNTTTYRTYVVLTFYKPKVDTNKVIVLDPGHGGSSLGATGNYLYEKDLNLDIALLAQDLFLKSGYDVYMTRIDDSPVELLDGADAANILDAASFISVHNNSVPEDMPESAKKLCRGTTVLYNSAALHPAKDLASIMCDELVRTLRTHKSPLQDRPNLVVLNSTWVPAVIAEVVMLPDPQDAKMISQRIYRQRSAEAIVTATEKYFRLNGIVQ